MHHERFQTHHGNYLDLLGSLPPRLAIVSDPPYGMGYKRGNKTMEQQQILWAKTHPSRPRMAKSLHYNTKNEPVIGDDKPFDPTPWLNYPWVALFGFQYFNPPCPPSGAIFVWDKKCGMFEEWSGSDAELVWTNGINNSVTTIRHLWCGVARDSQVKGSGGINASLHPTEKPVAVMMKIIQSLKIPKDVPILDPYMGSGTTGVAALRLGYTFIGVEILEKYYRIANERLAKEAAQALMPFDDVEEADDEREQSSFM